jgi:hypothetical protein
MGINFEKRRQLEVVNGSQKVLLAACGERESGTAGLFSSTLFAPKINSGESLQFCKSHSNKTSILSLI